MTISGFGNLSAGLVAEVARQFGTPSYVYDEAVIRAKCRDFLAMPNAFGLRVRYAVKANSSRALLQLISSQGLSFDLSSMNEGRRAVAAGVPVSDLMLTTQEVPAGADRRQLEEWLAAGLRYNACSLRQLREVVDFAAAHELALGIRIHPGEGTGESRTRNTGDKYSCFGVHLTDVPEALELARSRGIRFDVVHVHIGSGGDPETWRRNIDRELGFVAEFLPDCRVVNLGGGFREARMPDETPADVQALGAYARDCFASFAQETGRQLEMEIEPGTSITANAGYVVTRVIDEKWTGHDGFEFVVLDGGIEVNARPLLYGSRHPFYVVSKRGELISSEFDLSALDAEKDARIVVGKTCESGDSQTLDAHGHIVPRVMADPELDDLVVIGGAGAYCAAMTPFNYNSHVQAPEILLREDGRLQLIRARQTIEQIVQNELPLD